MAKRKRWHQYNFEDVYGKEWRTTPRIPEAQLSLSDVYNPEVLGEMSDDELIRRKTTSLRRCRICVKTTISGGMVECDVYPVWDRLRDTPRAQKSRESRESQKNLNNKNAQKQVVRLINSNFSKGDLLMTLTYEDGYYPTQKQARKDIQAYVTALKRVRKKNGMDPLKYLYVIEYVEEGESTKKVRIHHHIIINRMDRDLAESKWHKGRAESKYAEPDEDFGLEGYARYITKVSHKGHRRWSASKNLKKPIVSTNTTKLTRKKMYEMVRSGDDIGKKLEKMYSNKFRYTDSRIFYSDYVGGFYIYSKLRKKKGVEIVEENDKVAPEQQALPKSRVFIDVDWNGTLGDCEAIYSIVFEATVHGTPYTAERYGRITNTTRNRAMLIIANDAMQQFKTASDIELHAPGSALSTGINLNRFRRQQAKGYEGIKNSILIENLLRSIDTYGHKIKVISETANEYSDAEATMRHEHIRSNKFDLDKEDVRNE